MHYGDEVDYQRFAFRLRYVDNTVERDFRVVVDNHTARTLSTRFPRRVLEWRRHPLSIDTKAHRLATLV